ncbi:MAG: TIGR03564 family F420-dependent LLM class oxidoreductase [Actinomycetota bacterium]
MDIGINGSNALLAADMTALEADMNSAEDDGFSAYWLAQSGNIDALTAFAAHGPSSTSTELGTAVIPTWTVHPHAIAVQALTTQAAVGGRLVLGVGLSHEPTVRDRWKMAWERPVRQMLDYLDILQPLLAEGAAHHEGHFWSFEGEIARVASAPKVMLAALGTQMLDIAGRRTDGTILWCVGPRTVKQHIAPTINAAAADAGRPTPAVVCSLPVWVTDDPSGARAFLDQILATYAELPSYAAMLEREGVSTVGGLAIAGSETEVVERIDELAASGATQLSALALGGNPDEIAHTRQVLVAAQAARQA